MPTEQTSEEIAQSHRWHAIECNNLAWSLAEKTTRSAGEDEEMLNAAHASTFHWAKIGTELNQVRVKLLLGQVHALLGDGQTALAYARQNYDYITTHDQPKITVKPSAIANPLQAAVLFGSISRAFSNSRSASVVSVLLVRDRYQLARMT